MSTNSAFLYLNDKQHKFVTSNKRYNIFQAGRGTGKSTSVGDRQYRKLIEMPGSRGFLLGLTFKQINKNFLPEVIGRLEQYGLKEHISAKKPGHFVISKKPPAWWDKPIVQPKDYDNIVTFINGRTLDLISFDRPDTLRGGSYDDGTIDEAGDIDYSKLKKVLLPRLRGNLHHEIHKSPLHHSLDILGSMPWKDVGYWLIDDMKVLASKNPNEYEYIESSAEDNKHILGVNYFKEMMDMLGPITYQVEILNQRITQLPNAFYFELDDKRHLYQQYDYSRSENGWEARDVYPSPNQLLEISFDFNPHFSSCIVCQSDNKYMRVVNNFYVKNKTFDSLVDNVCEYYKAHQLKIVHIFGGKDGAEDRANSQFNYFQQLASRFRRNGWHAEIRYDYAQHSDKAFKLRHATINNILRESESYLPKIRIDQNNCKELILSMKLAPITNGFKKDKRSEKADIPQERATHLSDCFDNIVYPKYHAFVEQAGSPIEVFSV